MTPPEGSSVGGSDAEGAGTPGIVTGFGGVELLGTAPEIRETVSLGPGRPNGQVLAAVAVAVVGLGFWLLGGLGGGDGAASSSGVAGPQTTAAYQPADENSQGDPGADNGGQTGDRTTTIPRRRTTTSPTSQVLGGGSPLLGRVSGWSLFVGNGGQLHHLDLDSGLLRRVGLFGEPVAVSGSWLVVERSGINFALPLDDPENGERIDLSETGGVFDVHPGPEPGQVWLHGWFNDTDTVRGEARLVDLAQPNDVLATVPASSLYWTHFGRPLTDGTVVGSPAGGVFAAAGGGYRKVSDARLVGVSDNWAMVQTCPEPGRCALGWLERGTWRAADRPLPSDLDPLLEVGLWLSPDGRMLTYPDVNGGYQLFDVTRNQVVRGVHDGTPVASPDGRYVAVPEQGQVFVYDIDEGVPHIVRIGPGAGGRVVFVPTDS